jgi:hypothetical protein
MQPNLPPVSLWRKVAFTVLFWLFRHAFRPAAQYALLLITAAAFLVASPLVLLGKAWQAVKPRVHRVAAAVVLAFCHPRKNPSTQSPVRWCLCCLIKSLISGRAAISGPVT